MPFPPMAAHMQAPMAAPVAAAQTTNYAAVASALPEFAAAAPPPEFVWAQSEAEAAQHATYTHRALTNQFTSQPPQQQQQLLQTVEVIPAMVEVAAVVVPLDMKGGGAKRKRAVRSEAADGEAGFKPAPLPKLPRTKTKRAPVAAVAPETPTAARKRSVTQQSYQGPRRFRSPFCNCEVHLATNRGGLFNLSHRIIHQQPATTCDTQRYCLRKQYESSAVNKPQQRVTLYVSAASGLVNLRALFSSDDVLDCLTTSATVERLGPGALWNGHPVGATPGGGHAPPGGHAPAAHHVAQPHQIAPGSEPLLPPQSAVQVPTSGGHH